MNLVAPSRMPILFRRAESASIAALAVAAFVWFDFEWWLLAFVGLAWAFHVAVDRALGYGLKHPDGFEQTDLGLIGKSGKRMTTPKA